MLAQPGAFDGFQHLVLLMDHTVHGGLRSALLGLLVALIAPGERSTADDASAAARANGHALVAAGGIPLLVDLATGVRLRLQTASPCTLAACTQAACRSGQRACELCARRCQCD